MLRNIPNKIDQVRLHGLFSTLVLTVLEAMLKDIVDETSRGKYDFMYLRIGMKALFAHTLMICKNLNSILTVKLLDFANNCK